MSRDRFAAIERAFHGARQDLAEVGLLDEGVYLDRIECSQSSLPQVCGTMGYVFDHGPGWISRLAGFRAGTIYIPFNAVFDARGRGHTLLDVIRHEFAHAWYCLDPKFVDGPWFKNAFGARYTANWESPHEFDEAEFLFEYSSKSPAEDFADTFGMFLKFRRNVDRFRESWPGFHGKLKAVEKAVRSASETRVSSIRGPKVG
ncbi:MAG: hypothetical protein HYV07_14125 [Deltaproteobacteria bacterium]|nr:hypothetical protein [Deltaproteobacteria bacterium]